MRKDFANGRDRSEGRKRRSSAPKEDKEKREKGKLGGRNKGSKGSTFWCYGMVLMLRYVMCVATIAKANAMTTSQQHLAFLNNVELGWPCICESNAP